MNDYELQVLDLADRMLSTRKSLYHYVQEVVLTLPNYVDGQHIKGICDRIQEFLESDRPGLIVTTPPRHMKSTICSECLPAWFISNDPQREVMVASYNQSQARKMVKACRRKFETEWHRRVYPRVHITDPDNADGFMIEGKHNVRPNLIGAGIGAGLTGSGADLIIIDDPIKDMEEATSEVIRTKIWEWYTSVALTRLSPNGKVLIVMTRWHHDDLVGRLLIDNPGDWDIYHLPAISDDGKALWPERFSIDVLRDRQRMLGSRVFEALYQGRPSPAEGGVFHRDWIRYGEAFPKDAIRCRYWDKAATHEGGDWTVGCLMAFKDGRYAIEDIVRLQGSSYEVEQTIRQTAERDGPRVRIRMEQEPGSSGVDVIGHYSRNVLVGFDFRPDKVTGSKSLRAQTMSAALENGNLIIVRGSWNRDLIDEMLEFPYGKHDDQVDACSGAYRELSQCLGTSNVWFI
jgi:predicted phage terminase large subunit-like protein